MGKDYKDTLNLPRTEFPMRANLARREPKFQKFWEDNRVFYKLAYEREGEKFVLHDGPPYANGHIHLGHAENKILKDIVNKYKALKGYKIPFVPGWDTHGMPIENKVISEEGVKKLVDDPEKFRDPQVKAYIREKCRIFALHWVDVQREEFKRLGVFADWDNPYITLDKHYEASELEIFAYLVEEGYIYRERLPVHWCPHCRTALAMAEIEYKDKEDPSLYFMTRQKDGDLYILVWTTTPWTLISNRAFAFSPDIDYVIVKHRGRKVALAKARLEVLEGDYEILEEVKGSHFDGMVFEHPLFPDRESPAIMVDFVSTEEGTGIVHIAPGHGREDFEAGRKYGLEIFSPVDEYGRFTQEADRQTSHPLGVAGLVYHEGGEKAIERLKERELLYRLETIVHSYPHCWRCKNPLIFRATSQWFLNLEHKDLRSRALKAIDDVKWIPPQSKNRIYASVKERPDWVLSRQRVWGVFIPAVKCTSCGKSILDPKVIRNVARMTHEEGSDVWLLKPVDYFLYDGFKCPHCGATEGFDKEYDILDVWFDSGATGLIVLNSSPRLRWPADMYLEGSDQHRGWFNASLMLGMAVKNEPPYREVVTHGWTLDEQGRAMHKSLGNVIPPSRIIEKYGADILRLWVASSDYTQDIRLGDQIIRGLVDAYRKIRNTYRFMLSNLYDFTRDDVVPYEQLEDLDRYMLHRYARLIQKLDELYDRYEFHRVYKEYFHFINVELSSFYLDVLKDRLYTYRADSLPRRSAQTVIYHILKGILVMFAPILSHTAEEAYQFLPFRDEVSVFFESFPQAENQWINGELASEFEKLLEVREKVFPVLEVARKEKKIIGSNLDARVYLWSEDESLMSLLEKRRSDLREILVVSQVALEKGGEVTAEEDGLFVGVSHAEGEKCERCWIWTTDIKDGLCPKCRVALGLE